MIAPAFKPGTMPKAVICYICGRGYGTKSIGIHLKNCQKKWDIEQEKKPLKQRKQCPRPPLGFMDLLNNDNITHKDLEKVNNIAFEEYNDFALEPCSFCSRTFNAEAFKRHQRICTAEKPFKPFNKPTVVKAVVKPDIQVDKPKVHQVMNQTKNLNSKTSSLELQNNYQFNFTHNGEKSTVVTKVGSEPAMPNKKPSLKPESRTQKVSVPVGAQYDGYLIPCNKCGRRFADNRIGKHEAVCVENNKPKKVKLFHKPVEQQPKDNEEKEEKKAKWKAQHEALVENMRYVRKVRKAEIEGKDVRSIPKPVSSNFNPDLIECIFCNRKFNEEAHARHSKICKNVVNKPKPVNK